VKDQCFWTRDWPAGGPLSGDGEAAERPEAAGAATTAAHAAEPLPADVDVAIIGAGFTGLSAARNLARGGASVAVLEQHTFGWGASSRNGGMVSLGGKRGLKAWVEVYGRERAHRLWQATVDAVDLVESIVAEEGIDCAWQRSGTLECAWKPEHFGHIADYQRFLYEEVGRETTLIAPKDMAQEIGTRRFYGALKSEGDGGLDPARFTAGLAHAAREAGARIHEGTEVTALSPSPKGHRLLTSRGRLEAAEVLVATNGYTGAATPELRRTVIPIGSHIIVTEPLGKDLADELMPNRRMAWDTKTMLYYFRITPDDRMLFGARAAFRPVTTQQSGAILQRHMVELFPQLIGKRVEYTWDGHVGFTFDYDPNVGRRDGVWYALGYCGHGVALATFMGDRMAAAIAGRPVDNPFFELRTPPTNPFYRSSAWFLPLGDIYYRLKDRLT